MTQRQWTLASTPSPSTSQARRSFEIPISRSLAMSTASTTGGGQYQHAYTNKASTALRTSATPAQPRPTSQSSSLPAPSFFSNTPRPSQYASPQSVPHKRPFSEYQPTPQHTQKPGSRVASSRDAGQTSTLAEVMSKAKTAVATSRCSPPAASAPAKVSGPTLGGRSIHTNEPNMVAQVAARQREENARAGPTQSAPTALKPPIPEEPPLKLGETPSMTMHPNLIAQMVARKRAEAEMLGHRERWARRQREYRMSLSPGAQLTHGLNAHAGHSDSEDTPPRTVSNPLPARSTPTIPPLKVPSPIVFNAYTPITQTPAAETVSTPAAEDSSKPAAAKNDRRLFDDNNSTAGSPFSTSIVEFLKKATDDAGCSESLEPTQAISARTSAAATAASTPRPSESTKLTASTSAEATSSSQSPSEIPPLFSDKHTRSQQQPSFSRTMSTQVQSEGTHGQLQPKSSTGVLGQTPPGHPQQQGVWLQLTPHQPPAPRPIPYPPQEVGMPAYYRTEINQHWFRDGRNFAATPASTAPTANTYRQVAPSPHIGFTAYHVNPINPYIMPSYGLPPPPGALHTYGTAVAALEASERQKQQSTNAGYLTAADHVAGINLKFKLATQSNFSVPKRSS
ncbi:hypothetical protein PV04_00372 [Phialophora macrospora]|uniref:Uncharacterized protein n=1 Tax=Phialophora macrospora TaxID=1851006 RepID=A0A0D2FUR0_9EURO|nr:hypothetical protein PV04_00372 [Phialophora macrospora]